MQELACLLNILEKSEVFGSETKVFLRILVSEPGRKERSGRDGEMKKVVGLIRVGLSGLLRRDRRRWGCFWSVVRMKE